MCHYLEDLLLCTRCTYIVLKGGEIVQRNFGGNGTMDNELLSQLVKVYIDLWNSNPENALGDSKNVTAFSALYLWQYLTNDYDLKTSSSQDT